MDPLSLGRSCYEQRDYQGALVAFTEGIKISTGHILLTALDHRAATFEKLNQLQSALKDAKEMIELKPTLAKGYLRCAKVLQLKGQEELALKIYERGLRKVKVGGDPDRLVLQDMLNKLQQKQAPAKNFDPMVMLPRELAQMVCEHLDMRDRVICLAVSKPWKRFLESSHDLWTVLDVRSAQRFVRLDSLKAHLRRSNFRLEKAILTMNPKIFSGSNLEVLTRLSKKLSHLEITFAGYLSDSLLVALPKAEDLRTLIVKDAEIQLSSVVKALTCCPQLRTVGFSLVKFVLLDLPAMWPQLDSLESFRVELRGNHLQDPLNLDRLILSTPNLRSAALVYDARAIEYPTHSGHVDLSLWNKLEHLQLNHTNMSSLPTFPQTLRHLDLSHNHVWPSPLLTDESVVAIDLPHLSTFIGESDNLGLAVIFKLLDPSIKTGRLRTLHICGVDWTAFEGGLSVLPSNPSMPSLRTLSLGRRQDTESRLLTFLRLAPCVRYLDVSFTNITGVAIKELMTREVPPKRLIVNGCTNLSADAVEWARSLGADVDFNNEPVRRPGRRMNWRDLAMT